MKKKLFTIMLAFLVVFGVNAQDFGKAPVYKKTNQTQVNNFVKDLNAFKADQDAYVGNTGTGIYSSIILADGTTTATGTIASDPFPMAEEFAADGNVYRVDATMGFGTVNPDDGTFTSLGTLTGFAGTPTGLAWDWASSTMYVLVLDSSNLPHLCTLDIGTLVLTEIGVGTGMLIAMDFANDGLLYAPAIDDENLYQINPATGATTIIGSTGLGLNYGQDVSFDPISGQLYTVAGGDQNWFGTYDLATGAFTQISDIGAQCGVFVITKYPVEDAAPAPVENFTVTADAGGALTVDFSWDNPTLQHDGNALTELTEVVLYIDNVSVYTDNTAGIGGGVSETGFVVTGGMHSFKVVAFNSVGGSVPVSMGTFVGVDVAVTATNVPDMVLLNETFVPTVTVVNNGIGDQTFDVTLSDGDSYSNVATVTNLASGATQELTFPVWNASSAEATFTFTATAADPGSDFDMANNVATATLSVMDMMLFDFETGMPDNFETIDGDCGWMTGTDGSSSYFPIPPHTTYAYANDDACNANMSDVWMILPAIDFSGVSAPSLYFESFSYFDIFTIKVTTDGTNWNDVAVITPDNSAWKNETIDLVAYANEAFVKIAFHYNDNGVWGYGWAVDDILVSGQLVGSTNTVTFNVNMADSIASGYFVEGTDQLWLAGSMNTWTTPGDDAAYEMTESTTNDIYTVDVDLEDGNYEYKYFKIVGGVSSFDNGEWNGGANRTFIVAGADLTLDDVFGVAPVGIEELTAKGISIYPNPSNGTFNVNVESNFNLEIFDITGKVINTQVLNGTNTVTINNAGVYFLRFSNNEGSVTQKVIVQ